MTILALQDLDERSIASVELRRDLRLVRIHGPSLARLGVTAEWRAAAIARHPNFGRGHSGNMLTAQTGFSIDRVTTIRALCVAGVRSCQRWSGNCRRQPAYRRSTTIGGAPEAIPGGTYPLDWPATPTVDPGSLPVLSESSFSPPSIPNHAARSTSGNSRVFPDRGGHSIEKVLLRNPDGSKSAWIAQANTVLPPGCLSGCKGTNVPSGVAPVSSSTSRRAAVSGSSASSNSPLGIDQAASSFFAQNGPPGCTRRDL